MAQFRTSRTFDTVFILSLVVLLWFGYQNRTAITDWMYFNGHPETAQITKLARAAGLSKTGEQLLWRGDPVLTDASTIKQVCDAERIGCLTEKGQIYVLDDPANPNQTIVTAAHEMLHLAYRRLSTTERNGLDAQLDAAISRQPNHNLSDELADLTKVADRRDEAHSLLGTEYRDLPSSLEHYFQTYFSDRSKVIAAETASNQ